MAVTGAHRHASSVFVVPTPNLAGTAAQAVVSLTSDLQAKAHMGSLQDADLRAATESLLLLAGEQAHPLLHAALLARAGRLVVRHDPGRGRALLRESFRLFPDEAVGARLRDLASDDESWLRLGRLGHLVESVVALADSHESKIEHLLVAAQTQIGLGHGRAALRSTDQLLALQPDHDQAQTLAAIAQTQIDERAVTLQEQRLALTTLPDGERLEALLSYAELLVMGDEPLSDAVAVLADALDAGAPAEQIAPLWVELARAMGSVDEQVRALSVAVTAGEALPNYLAFADELANLPEVDRRYPHAAATSLAALAYAIPDDPQLRARLEVCEHLLEPETAELRLDAMRVRCLRDRDKAGECQACLTLAWLAVQHGDQEGAERHYRRVRSLMPTHPEALDFFERAYRESGDWKRLQVALVQRQSAAEGRELVHVTAELARVNEGPLAAPDRATEAWERVLSLQPDHQEAAAALARLYEAQGRWAGLRDVLEATARMAQARVAIESAARQRAISAWERMAQLHETPGQLPSRHAALQAWQAVQALSPTHPVALDRIRTALQAMGNESTWADVLAQAVAAAALPGSAVPAADRLAWLVELGDVSFELGRSAAAQSAYAAALSLAPEQADLLPKLARLARATGDQGGLRKSLRDSWQSWLQDTDLDNLPPETRTARTEVFAEAANLAETAGDTHEARTLWKALADLLPGSPEAVSGVIRNWTETRSGLRDWLRTQADTAPIGGRRLGVLVAWVQVAEADGAWEEVSAAAARWLALEPGSPAAQLAMARALLQEGRIQEVRKALSGDQDGAAQAVSLLLESASALTRPGAFLGRQQRRLAAAQLLATELGDSESAVAVSADLLTDADFAAQMADRRRSVAEAVLGFADTASDKLAVAEAAVTAAEAGAEAATGVAARSLRCKQAQWLQQLGRWSESWVAATTAMEDALSSGGEEVGVSGEIAAVWALIAEGAPKAEQQADVADQVAFWAELLGDTPLSTAMWQTLIDWSDVVALAPELTERAWLALSSRQPGDRAVALHAAQLAARRGDWNKAATVLAEASALQPDDEELTDQWLQAERERVSAGAGATALIAALEVALQRSPSAALWTELADLQGAEGAHAAAAQAWLAALELDATTPAEPVLAAMAQLAEAGQVEAAQQIGDQLWPIVDARQDLGLMDALLQLRLQAAATDAARIPLWKQLIDLRGHALGDLQGAFDAAATWLAACPNDTDAIAAVAHAVASAGDAVSGKDVVQTWLAALAAAGPDLQAILRRHALAALESLPNNDQTNAQRIVLAQSALRQVPQSWAELADTADAAAVLAKQAAQAWLEARDQEPAVALLLVMAADRPADEAVAAALDAALLAAAEVDASGWPALIARRQAAWAHAAATGKVPAALGDAWLDALGKAAAAGSAIGAGAVWQAWQEIAAAAAAEDNDHWTDVLATWLASVDLTDLTAPGLSGWQVLIARRQAAGSGAAEAVARREVLERFGDSIDTAAERRALAHCLGDRAGEPLAALSEWQGLLAEGWADDAASAAMALADATGGAADLDEFLQAVAESTESPAARAAQQMQLANRAAARGDSDKALRLLDAVLLDDPGHTEAFALRGDLLHLTEPDPQAWIAHWTHGRDHATNPQERVAAILALARAWLQLENGDQAWPVLVDLLSAPSTPDDDWLQAAEVATATAALLGDRASLAALWCDVAADRPDRLGAVFALAVDADWPPEDLAQLAEAAAPGTAAAWDWLKSWSHHAESAHTHAQRLLDRAASLIGEDQATAAKSAWQDALVFAAHEQLTDMASHALAGLQLALPGVDQWPADTAPAVLEAALAVARSQGADTAVASLTSRLAEQATGKRASDLWHQNAEALLGLGQAADALDALDMALVCDDTGAGLQQLRAEVLLSLGRAEEAWVCLRVAGSPLRAAELAWQAGNLDAAVEALTDALSADPASEALWHAVEQLAAYPTALAAMIEHLNPLWQMVGQQGRAVALWKLQIGQLSGEAQRHAQRALAVVLRSAGAEAEAYALWLTVATTPVPGTAEDDLLAQVLEALVESQEAAAAAALTERWQQDTLEAARAGVWPAAVTRAVAGHLAEQAEASGQPDVAAAAWEAAWRAEPTDADARDIVLSWCRRLGDLGHWSDMLAEALVHAPAQAAAALLLERADVLRQLQQSQEALQCLTQVAALSSLEPSQSTELVSALEHLARQPETADGALALLEQLLGEQQDSEAQVRLLRLRLDRATTTEERTRIALALAEVQSGGQAAGGAAVSTLLGILESSPSVATLAALEALARPGTDDAAVARALELVSAAPLPTVDLHAVAQHGVDFAARRGDAAGQEHWLRRALSLDRNDTASQEDLESLLDVQGRLDELVDMLHTRLQLELAQSPLPSDARRLALHRLATLATTLNRPPVALWAWRAVSAMDPTEPDGPTGEVELLRELDDIPGLVQALQRLATVTSDLTQRAEHWTEAARLTAKILKKEEDAAKLYKTALQANGRLDEPFVWLEKHFAGQPDALAELYELRAAAVEPGPTRILVLRKQAHALLDLGDGLGACTVLDNALKHDPGNAAVLDELQRLSEQAGAWSIHTSVLRLRLDRETRREPRVALLGQLARVLLGELRDAEAGEPIVDALRDLAPREPVTRHALAMLQAASGEPREAAAGLEQILKESQDLATQIALHQQLADLYLGPLDSPARAIRELQKLIAIEPKRWSARRRLCDLYAARESWEALVESLRQWLVVVTGERDKARGTLSLETGRMLTSLHVELGQSLGKLKRWPEAVAELRRAVALGGQSKEAAAALATGLVEVGEIAEAQEHLSWLVENLQQDSEAAALADAAAQLGQLYLKQGELGASRDAFRKALQVQPDHMLATLGSGQMLLALGDTDRALRQFDAVLKLTDVPVERQADAQEGLGRCRLAKGQKEQARTAFQAALRLVPGHKGAREGMLEV